MDPLKQVQATGMSMRMQANSMLQGLSRSIREVLPAPPEGFPTMPVIEIPALPTFPGNGNGFPTLPGNGFPFPGNGFPIELDENMMPIPPPDLEWL